jgi:membrane protease YdiL (CAAX protease family)
MFTLGAWFVEADRDFDGVAFGLAVGLGAIVLCQGLFCFTGLFDRVGPQVAARLRALGLASLGGYAVAALFYSFAHSLLEEYYWRWFVYGFLRTSFSRTPANAMASISFAAHHAVVLSCYFPTMWMAALLATAVAIGGSVWRWMYERHRTLLGIWLSHLLVDLAIMTVGWFLVASYLGSPQG